MRGECVFACVHVFICMSRCMCIGVYVCVLVCMCARIGEYVFVCVLVCMRVCVGFLCVCENLWECGFCIYFSSRNIDEL